MEKAIWDQRYLLAITPAFGRRNNSRTKAKKNGVRRNASATV
jgi:hypothetical protein